MGTSVHDAFSMLIIDCIKIECFPVIKRGKGPASIEQTRQRQKSKLETERTFQGNCVSKQNGLFHHLLSAYLPILSLSFSASFSLFVSFYAKYIIKPTNHNSTFALIPHNFWAFPMNILFVVLLCNPCVFSEIFETQSKSRNLKKKTRSYNLGLNRCGVKERREKAIGNRLLLQNAEEQNDVFTRYRWFWSNLPMIFL